MESIQKRVHKTFHLAFANLLFFLNTYIFALVPTVDAMNAAPYQIWCYLYKFRIVRAMVWIWRSCHEEVAEVLFVVWPITLAVSSRLEIQSLLSGLTK